MMPVLLSIETSTQVCSVALHKGATLLAEFKIAEEKSHSKLLTHFIDTIVKDCGIELEEVDAFAVSKGPGSFTGLRIGVSTVKGLCFAIDKPLIAVNTLEAMAWNVNNLNPDKHYVCPMLDARRMEVYSAILNAESKFIKETEAVIVDEDSFKDVLENHKIIFCGNGMPKCKNTLEKHHNALFMDNINPLASSIGALAYSKFLKKEFENLAYFEPFYLKDFYTKAS